MASITQEVDNMGKFFLGQARWHMAVVSDTQEAQTGGLQVQSKAGQLTETEPKYNKTVVQCLLNMCKAWGSIPSSKCMCV